ncbi:MAG: hypothetical protein KBG84_02650 [Planctomycetes bacterium]|nr:hypothetical protein [Planctomycetota bacterium]
MAIKTIAGIACCLAALLLVGCSPSTPESHQTQCVELGNEFFKRFVSGDLDGAMQLCRYDGIRRTELESQYKQWRHQIPSNPRLIQSTAAVDYQARDKGVVSPPPARVENTELEVQIQYWWQSNQLIVHAFAISQTTK